MCCVGEEEEEPLGNHEDASPQLQGTALQNTFSVELSYCFVCDIQHKPMSSNTGRLVNESRMIDFFRMIILMTRTCHPKS